MFNTAAVEALSPMGKQLFGIILLWLAAFAYIGLMCLPIIIVEIIDAFKKEK